MKHNKLFEGVKFGDKEKALVLQNSEDFNIGIEYEFNPEDIDVPDPENLVDLTQPIEDILADIKKFYRDHDEDFDDTYGNIVVDILNGHRINGYTAYGVYELYKLFKELTRELHNMMPTDTVTDDMFSDEKAKAYMNFFYTTIKDSDDIDIEKIHKVLTDDDLTDSKNFYMLMDILDIYFDGEFIKGTDQKKKSFYDLYSLFRKKPEIFNLEAEDVEDEDVIERYKDDITALLEALMTSDFKDVYKDEEHNYTINEYGMTANEFDINDYIDYVINYENIEVITNALIEDFKNSVLDGIFTLDAVIDEERIRDEIGNIDRIEDEHDEMKEVVTHQMQLSVALENIRRMFKYLSQNASVNDYAGMHISISTNKYDLDDFNIMKFVTLMHVPYILQYFPERGHVNDLQEIVEGHMKNAFFKHAVHGIDVGDTLPYVIQMVTATVESRINTDKFQTIKFGDYKYLDGRIELRFFGGENYNTQYEEIVSMLLRSLYLMNIAYTDVYNKEYYKQVVKTINSSISHLSPYSVSYIYKSLNNINKKYSIDDIMANYMDQEDLPEELVNDLKKYFKDDYEIIFRKLFQGWRSW